jgi:chlorobactene glucosyltransferase
MAMVIIGYLPLPLVHHTPWASFAAANGQLLAFRRKAYQAVGGHESVRGEIVEDIVLARRIKKQGFRLRMADGAGIISCRMYQNWPEVRDGYAKNIIAGYGNSVFWLAVAALFHWLVFLLPWLWLALGWFGSLPGWPLWPLLLVALGVGIRMLTAAVTRQRLADAFLLPVSTLLMTRIAFQAVWWRWCYGGPRWKGRTITPKHSVEDVSYD